MDKVENQSGFPRLRLWPALPVLIILGLAVHLLIPQISSLERSWSILKGMTWWAFVLAIFSQAFSYLGFGFILCAILNLNQRKLSVLKGAMIAMASASIGLVAGGWVGGAAATFTWVHREDPDGNSAALAGTLPSLLNNGVLVGVAILGTTYLLLLHDLSSTQLIEFVLILLGLGILTVSLVLALRFPNKTTQLALWLSGRWAVIRRKPFKSENTIRSVRQYYSALNTLKNKGWLRPLLGAVANIGFDMLTLYFVFVAVGHQVSLGVLFAGYGLPLILGKIAFLIPGGVGVIEGSMVVLYTSLQVPNEISVVVILGYRLISFWLPTLLGFVSVGYLSRKSSNY